MIGRIFATLLILWTCGVYMFAVKDVPPIWDRNFRKMNSLALVVAGAAILFIWVAS